MKIRQIELLSQDLNKAEKFYSGTLGLPIESKDDTRISFAVGTTSKLVFSKAEGVKPVYHFAFDIPHNQLHEAERWLSSRVALIQFENKNIIDFPNWNAKSLYFLDTNGNVLEFIARFSNDNASDKPFDGSSIISISEIAFVTDNVRKLASELIHEKGLAYFKKQVQREDFSVLGEDDGLLILVDSERNWFPTPIQAEKFWTRVLVENDAGILEFEYA